MLLNWYFYNGTMLPCYDINPRYKKIKYNTILYSERQMFDLSFTGVTKIAVTK